MLTVVGFLLDLFSLVSQTYLNPKQTYILHELQRQNKKDNQEMVVMWTVVTRNPALPQRDRSRKYVMSLIWRDYA